MGVNDHRFDSHRLVAIAAALAVAATAACSASDSDATPTRPDTGTETQTETEAETETETANPTTTGPAVTSSAPTSSRPSTTAAAVTTTTAAPTTTIDPIATYTEPVCADLSTLGYESRKAVLAAATADVTLDDAVDGGAIAAVRERCPDALERIESAVALEQRVRALKPADRVLDVDGLACDSQEMSARFTNVSEFPLGVHVEFVLTSERTGHVMNGREPTVVWSIAPGETALVRTGVILGIDTYRCSVRYSAFDASPTDADASLAEPEHPEFTGDDPADWLPALLQFERETDGSGDPDRAAVTEDLRSIAYDDVLASATEQPPANPDEAPTITVCERGQDRPDPDHLGVVYAAHYPDRTVQTDDGPEFRAAETLVRHGLFRRGRDGQWRWLTWVANFDSAMYGDDACGTPSGLARQAAD